MHGIYVSSKITITFAVQMSEILTLDKVKVAFDGRSLFAPLQLTLDRGEMVCITGESGCGKTTLLRAIMGFVPLEEGAVCYKGAPMTVQQLGRFRRETMYVPQDLNFSVEWVSEMVTALFDLRTNRHLTFRKEALWTIWDELGLERALYDKRIAQLSGGQRQRVMLSVCALTGKEMMLADEPTSALDEDGTARVAQFLKRMAKERGTAVLAVSHNKRFMRECDRVVTL